MVRDRADHFDISHLLQLADLLYGEVGLAAIKLFGAKSASMRTPALASNRPARLLTAPFRASVESTRTRLSIDQAGRISLSTAVNRRLRLPASAVASSSAPFASQVPEKPMPT